MNHAVFRSETVILSKSNKDPRAGLLRSSLYSFKKKKYVQLLPSMTKKVLLASNAVSSPTLTSRKQTFMIYGC